jgi:hypothetical protein
MNAKLIGVIGNLIIPFLIFLGLAVWNWKEGGTDAVLKGFTFSGNMLLGVAVVVIIAFLITGQAEVIAIRHVVQIKEYLNGQHGIWGAAAAGIFAPTMSSFPFMEKLWGEGKAPLGVVLSVVISARLLNFQNILYFIPFLGSGLTAISIGVGLLIMAVFIPAALLAAKLFH